MTALCNCQGCIFSDKLLIMLGSHEVCSALLNGLADRRQITFAACNRKSDKKIFTIKGELNDSYETKETHCGRETKILYGRACTDSGRGGQIWRGIFMFLSA